MNAQVPGHARPAADAGHATFSAFDLAPPLADALRKAGFTAPTPIQAKALPHGLEGRDLIAIAQTGTGKTAAFALPMLQRLAREPRRPEPGRARMLVLSPTRELATQIADSFKQLGSGLRLSLATVFGGVGEKPQIAAAARGLDVLVATPGRLVELVERGAIKLDRVEVFVLDEADRMLDLGFIRDIRVLLRHLPRQRQSMMFSATMPPAIREIAEAMLANPVRISVTPEVVTVERIRQHVCHVPAASKRPFLVALLGDPALERVIVFCRTKAGANRVAEHLSKAGLGAAAIHGNKSQNAREAALAAFKAGKVRVLVATDLASRGIDAPGVTHVINFELPNEPESYVHRIGRSARAGRDGVAISLCDPSERAYLRDIERLTKVQIDVMSIDGFAPAAEAATPKPERAGRSERPDPRHDQAEPRRQGRRRRPRKPAAQAPAAATSQRPAQRQGQRPAAPSRNGGSGDKPWASWGQRPR